jgi:hypothetical protein
MIYELRVKFRIFLDSVYIIFNKGGLVYIITDC